MTARRSVAILIAIQLVSLVVFLAPGINACRAVGERYSSPTMRFRGYYWTGGSARAVCESEQYDLGEATTTVGPWHHMITNLDGTEYQTPWHRRYIRQLAREVFRPQENAP